MPRMPKYLKREGAFFLGDCGRKKYNPLCRKCERSCKQSFRAVVILSTAGRHGRKNDCRGKKTLPRQKYPIDNDRIHRIDRMNRMT